MKIKNVQKATGPKWLSPLSYNEAIRALLCMLPMIVALFLGQYSILSSLGQGGFYYSYLPLPEKFAGRLVNSFLLFSVGLGFYLIGGNVVQNVWLGIGYTFMVGVILVLLSGWKVIGPLAFSFISLYSAGLNSSSAENTSENFLAFVIAIGWAAVISFLPIWKGVPRKEAPPVDDIVMYETSLKMGLGTAVSLAISYLLEFGKLGWAVSGVGNVIRFDQESSKIRAKLRMVGTVIGVLMVGISFHLTSNLSILITLSVIYAFLNGLLKYTKFGMFVIFYTAMIMTLYSINDIESFEELNFMRIVYNLTGVLVGLFIVYYPFPYLYPKIRVWLQGAGKMS